MDYTKEQSTLDWDAARIATLVREALDEDIGSRDLTTDAMVPPDREACARIIAKQDLILAGLPLVERVFRTLDPGVRIDALFSEGTAVATGQEVVRIRGRARAILSGERTAMNFLAHLSGVATLTRRFVEAIAGTQARIRDTRKTTPLLRAPEKYAVRMGGGANHRFGLFDAILIKENHIAMAGGIAPALMQARTLVSGARQPREMTAYESFQPPSAPGIEPTMQIEVRDEPELREALSGGADSVLLDNLAPADVSRLVRIARATCPGCSIEVSGGITLETVRAYAETGVDYISVGAITHSAPAADLSLLVEPQASE